MQMTNLSLSSKQMDLSYLPPQDQQPIPFQQGEVSSILPSPQSFSLLFVLTLYPSVPCSFQTLQFYESASPEPPEQLPILVSMDAIALNFVKEIMLKSKLPDSHSQLLPKKKANGSIQFVGLSSGINENVRNPSELQGSK